MSTELAQGTPEWHAARVGIITGSRVGAVLGKSPFQSRKALLRQMVDEANGISSDFDSPAMRWGREHEAEAVKLYEFLYAGDEPVTETGFHVRDGLGASPDRLVGEKGLVEVKCPFGIREDKSPQFTPLKDLPHYHHQIQLQLFATDREWCDFFQWTPNGYTCERVERLHAWYGTWKDVFDEFMVDYHALLSLASTGGPEEKVGRSARWAAAAEEFHLASVTARAAKDDMDRARDVMLSLMEEVGIDQCEGSGVKVQRIERAGSIDYKALCKDQLTDDVVSDIEESYRKKGSVFYQVKETGK